MLDNKYIIYHNPRCSKSRETLSILEEQGVELEIKKYLDEKLSVSELSNILEMGNLEAKEIVRQKDDAFKELEISLDDKDSILKAIENNSKLLERPIVVHKGRAMVARPPEKVKELF